MRNEADMEADACNSSNQEAELGHPGFKISLEFIYSDLRPAGAARDLLSRN